MSRENGILRAKFPTLPTGYRWKVETSGYPNVLFIKLEKRIFFGWWKQVDYEVAGANPLYAADRPENKAQRIYDLHFGPDAVIGVSEK